MATVALLGGTHARDRQRPRWFEEGSAFVAALEAAGHQIPPVRHRPTWSTSLEGLWGGDGTWEDLGRYLALYVEREGVRRWVVHSHAGNGILHCAAKGIPLETVLLVGTPVRPGWEARYARARKHICRLLHIHSPVDGWQTWGSVRLTSPRSWLSAPRVIPGAVPIAVPGASHTGLLDPALWSGRGWFRLLE